MTYVQGLAIAGGFVAFGMAFAIGANDVANALGTSVGSKALTVKRAIILGAIFEFLGTLIMGNFVTGTIKQGILHVDAYVLSDSLNLFALGMFSSLLAATVWLLIATWFALPVSTTHTIVAGIVSFSLVEKGWSSVRLTAITKILISWVLSPFIGCIIAFIMFYVTEVLILRHSDPYKRSLSLLPWFSGLTLSILVLFIIQSEAPTAGVHVPWWASILIFLGIFILSAVLVKYILVPKIFARDQLLKLHGDQEEWETEFSVFKLEDDSSDDSAGSESAHFKHQITSDAESEVVLDSRIDLMDSDDKADNEETVYSTSNDTYQSEKNFVPLMVLTAVFVAFAHGSNDVANAVGPFAAILEYRTTGSIETTGKSRIPYWVLVMGGVGIVAGLAALGYRVMKTVGENITKLTHTRGYCAQLATATTVMIASYFGVPISTTHTLVGSITGIGLVPVKSYKRNNDKAETPKIQKGTVVKILIGWLVTVLAGSLLTIVFYKTFKALLL